MEQQQQNVAKTELDLINLKTELEMSKRKARHSQMGAGGSDLKDRVEQVNGK
jgi:hypothetical protein